ncbi:MAG: primosomal protein N', partial [Clostridiaceae bacterium]|nr:primosomal protein N' [Clostridiaceae bacterium]
MKNISSVVISNSIRKFDKEYSYIIPDDFVGKVEQGIRVIVPFGKSNRLVEGYVTKVFLDEATEGLKEISTVIDSKSVLSPEMLKLVYWMKHRYICTYSDVIRCMLPPGIGVVGYKAIKLLKTDSTQKGNKAKIILKLFESGGELLFDELKAEVDVKNISKYLTELEKGGIIQVVEQFESRVKKKSIKAVYLVRPAEEVIEDIENNRIKNIGQIRILEMLIDNEFLGVTDIARFAGVSASVLKTLNKYGYIDYKDIEVIRD